MRKEKNISGRHHDFVLFQLSNSLEDSAKEVNRIYVTDIPFKWRVRKCIFGDSSKKYYPLTADTCSYLSKKSFILGF